MSGEVALRYLLANSAGVTAVFPAAQIVAGAEGLALNSPLPGIEIRLISGSPRNNLSMRVPGRLHTDRIQVSWLFKGRRANPTGAGSPGVDHADALVLAALPYTRGTVAGVDVDSIIPDVRGPNMPADDAAGIYQGSRDFIVRWRE